VPHGSTGSELCGFVQYPDLVYRVSWVSMTTASPMGQQRYEHEIQSAIRRVAGPEWSFEVVTVSSARSRIPGARRVSARLNNIAPLALSRAMGRTLYGNPDLVHRFDLRLPTPWGREVVTVHDLPPLRFPDEGTLTRSALAGARRAARIIAPSRFAADEIASLIEVDEVEVIPNGISSHHFDSVAATDGELAALGVSAPFVMHAGGATQRKNLGGLADAWRLLEARRSDLWLVLCGPADPRRAAAFAGLSRVVKPGRLEPSIVGALMRRASAVVLPSTYEGFGLPALEAMVCGTPVVAARRGALPEVCGDAALLVEPDGGAIAEGIERVLADPGLAGELRERGARRAADFSWESAARAHLRVYRAALK
jgi:glycosyltransferase involved in cell wall biosynthesis